MRPNVALWPPAGGSPLCCVIDTWFIGTIARPLTSELLTCMAQRRRIITVVDSKAAAGELQALFEESGLRVFCLVDRIGAMRGYAHRASHYFSEGRSLDEMRVVLTAQREAKPTRRTIPCPGCGGIMVRRSIACWRCSARGRVKVPA